jgi:hypothetical protein
MSRYDLALLRSCADDVTPRPGTVVPMPTSPQAEQLRIRGPVPRHASGARKITAHHRAGLGEEDCAGCCPWPYGPALAPCPPAVGLLRGQQGSGQRRAQRRGTTRRPLGATFLVAIRLRLFAATRPSLSSVTGGSLRHGWPGSGPNSARPPGGLENDCQSGSLDRQVSRRIKWRRTCHPRPCSSACRTASQPSYS